MNTEQRDLISQSALLKHRQAILAGGKLQEYVPVSAICEAELINAEEVTRCSDCIWFRVEDNPAILPTDCRRGFCICWNGETESDQYCSRVKPKPY